MNTKEAIQIISREYPCRHDSYESVGIADTVHCVDCGAYFELSNKPKHDKAADDFEAAIVFLSALGEGVNPKPQLEAVEVKRWLHKHKVNLISDIEPIHNLEDWITLSGTYEKPVKPKVKKWLNLGELEFDSDKYIVAGAAFYEMANRPGWLAGKTGRFIFEYEEAAE